MRSTISILCFFAIFSAAAAEDNMFSVKADAYYAARDRFITAHKGSQDLMDKGYLADRAKVESLLRDAIPVWGAPGFSSPGEMNLSVFDDPHTQGLSVLNGIVYRRGTTQVIVTTRPLMKRWLAEPHRGTRIAVGMEKAFRSEDFWSEALATDAGADIQYVLSQPGSGATVVLADFTQDLSYDKPPDHILAVVLRGERVFVADQIIDPPLAPFTACKRAYQKGEEVYPFAPTVQESARKHEAALHTASGNYLTCFAREFQSRPSYREVEKQAASLINILR